MFYVYILIDPRTELPFYVGKGKNDRMYHHEKREKSHNIHLTNKIRKIKSDGYEIIYKKFDCYDEKSALKLEYDLINKYGRFRYDDGGILVNVCEGGGITPNLVGQENGFYGRTHSEEARKSMSEKRKLRKNTQYQKDTASKLFKDRWQCPEYREIMKESKKNYLYTEKHKQRISESNIGKKMSDESKQKIRESKTGSHPNLSDDQSKAIGERLKQSINALLINGKGLPWQDKINKNPEKIEKTAITHTGMKRSICAKNNMSKGQKESYENRKINNTWFPPNFSGYYITPLGRFVSRTDAAIAHNCNASTVTLRCRSQNDVVMTPNKLKNATDLTIEEKNGMVGRTWNAVGWSFDQC